MKLKSLKVQNFKCIEDSEEFRIDQVTCLMGKNEAGKTAILEALYKLNPVESEKADFNELEYPRRHITTSRQRGDLLKQNVLTTTWELDKRDIVTLKMDLGVDVIKSKTFTISKGYGNSRQWSISVDEVPFIKTEITKANFNAVEKSVITKSNTVEELIASLDGLENRTEKHEKLLTRLRELFPEGGLTQFVRTKLATRIPKFLYFDTYDRLPGKVALTDIKPKIAQNSLSFSEKIFVSLLDMTSSSIEDVESIGHSENLIMELEAIQNNLTQQIFEYWSQNNYLEVKFRFDHSRPDDPPPFNQGFIFNTRIYNRRHTVTVSFDERSSGFIWFFSFLIWFSQVQKNYGKNLFILLDEPGLSLHGKAQQDLLRYINEKLRPHYQVMYSAHSPFMIDTENIFGLRTVEDVVRESQLPSGERREEIYGTKVSESVFGQLEDSVFPLQGVVGFDLAKTFLAGPYIVVVEGPTESALFHWFSRQLALKGRNALDVRWAVCPAEGASKITSFVSLFSPRAKKIAAVLDYHEGQKRMVNDLSKSGLLKDDNLLKTTDYCGKQEADIEDLLGWKLYVHLVSNAYGLVGPYAIPPDEPDDALRAVKVVEDHFRTLPSHYSEFSHFTPIEYLIGIDHDRIPDLPGLDDALDIFEKLFQDINGLE